MLRSAKTILVTGGAGFAGSWLVDALLERSEEARVVVVDNLFNGKEVFVAKSPRVALEKVDLRDGPKVAQLIETYKPEVVFHLAALHYIPYCDAHPAEAMDVNVVATQNLLEACRKFEPDVLIAASTVAVYPVRDEPNDEDSPLGPVNIYGLSKWVNEKQVELHARNVKTRCVVARFSNIYGPRETNPHVIPEILLQIHNGHDEISLGNVKPKRDYIYVTDIAKGLIAIAERSKAPFRIYNLGTGVEHSVEEIVTLLAKVSGRPLQVKVDPKRVRATDRMHLVCNLRRTRSELGWEPEHTIETGMAALWKSTLA